MSCWKLLEKYREMYPDYYFELNENCNRIIAYPLFFLKELGQKNNRHKSKNDK